MEVAVIITAAGSGTRLGLATPKALVPLAGQTILERAVAGALASGVVGHIVVTAPADLVDAVRALVPDAVVVAGGATRQESVAAGVAALPEEVTHVLVHDAARPLTPPEVFGVVVAALEAGHDAVIPALPVTDTIKRVETTDAPLAVECVRETVPREDLRAVQTPQGFERALLERAHAAAAGDSHTDDGGLVERLGEPVWLVPGDPRSMKITTAWDLKLAEFLVRN